MLYCLSKEANRSTLLQVWVLSFLILLSFSLPLYACLSQAEENISSLFFFLLFFFLSTSTCSSLLPLVTCCWRSGPTNAQSRFISFGMVFEGIIWLIHLSKSNFIWSFILSLVSHSPVGRNFAKIQTEYFCGAPVFFRQNFVGLQLDSEICVATVAFRQKFVGLHSN